MIISLRGTHGSGKSTVVRALFKICKAQPFYGALGPKLPEAYAFTAPKGKEPLFYVVGPYTTVCGGCDRIQPFDLILDLIQKYAAKGHVLFEGAIIGCVYGRTGTLMEPYGQEGVFLVLDTPMEECIRRVKGRRGERSDDREFNPKNLEYKYKQLASVVAKVEQEKVLRVVRVSSDDAADMIIRLFKEAPRHAAPQAVRPTAILGARAGKHPPETSLW